MPSRRFHTCFCSPARFCTCSMATEAIKAMAATPRTKARDEGAHDVEWNGRNGLGLDRVRPFPRGVVLGPGVLGAPRVIEVAAGRGTFRAAADRHPEGPLREG